MSAFLGREMIAFGPAYDGTGDYTATFAYDECTSTDAGIVNATAIDWSSNYPDQCAQQEPDRAERKAIARRLNRVRSLDGMLTLSLVHCLRPRARVHEGATRAPRPTLRCTATATRNFRRSA